MGRAETREGPARTPVSTGQALPTAALRGEQGPQRGLAAAATAKVLVPGGGGGGEEALPGCRHDGQGPGPGRGEKGRVGLDGGRTTSSSAGDEEQAWGLQEGGLGPTLAAQCGVTAAPGALPSDGRQTSASLPGRRKRGAVGVAVPVQTAPWGGSSVGVSPSFLSRVPQQGPLPTSPSITPFLTRQPPMASNLSYVFGPSSSVSVAGRMHQRHTGTQSTGKKGSQRDTGGPGRTSAGSSDTPHSRPADTHCFVLRGLRGVGTAHRCVCVCTCMVSGVYTQPLQSPPSRLEFSSCLLRSHVDSLSRGALWSDLGSLEVEGGGLG